MAITFQLCLHIHKKMSAGKIYNDLPYPLHISYLECIQKITHLYVVGLGACMFICALNMNEKLKQTTISHRVYSYS